jgi:hypothetical protein
MPHAHEAAARKWKYFFARAKLLEAKLSKDQDPSTYSKKQKVKWAVLFLLPFALIKVRRVKPESNSNPRIDHLRTSRASKLQGGPRIRSKKMTGVDVKRIGRAVLMGMGQTDMRRAKRK